MDIDYILVCETQACYVKALILVHKLSHLDLLHVFGVIILTSFVYQ